MTLDEAARQVTTTAPHFEIDAVDICEVWCRAFKNIPPHAGVLLHASRQAQTNGKSDYVVFHGERGKCGEFIHDINKVANSLERELEVGKGTPVANAMRSCPDYLVLIIAIASLGGVTVFLNAWWTAEELKYAFEDSLARLVFCGCRALPETAPIGYAGRDGTVDQSTCGRGVNTLRPAVLIVTLLFHVTATNALFLLRMPAGAKVVLMENWDVIKAARIIDAGKITRFLGVPTQSFELAQAAKTLGTSLESLDYIGSSVAKRSPEQVAGLADAFPNADVATGWGMTEANGIGMAGDDYVKRPGSAGRLYPPIQEMRFVDEDGQYVLAGYLNKPDATADVLQGGWLRTGDAVIEACAFSVPDERLGEGVGAAIQTDKGQPVTHDDLTRFLCEYIAKFKVSEHIRVPTTPLPRGATEKINRRGLRDQCLTTLDDKKKCS